jgi:uncharacterized protein YdeI (BOF family)
MKFFKYIALFLSFIIMSGARADGANGTWKYEKSSEYFGLVKDVKPPKYTTIEVTDTKVALQGTCIAKLKSEDFFFSDTFQSLVKEDVSRKQLDSYLQKTYQFSLSATKLVYTITGSTGDCHKPVMEFLVAGDKLLVPIGGSIFHSYVKVTSSAQAPAPVQGSLAFKLSALPFNQQDFVAKCMPKIVDKKGVPHTTDKCGPTYMPYVADAKSADPIVKAIGNHNFQKGGARFAQEFATPFDHGLHPTFLVFPPLKDVYLVRVEDFDIGKPESRDLMSGVYLSIKDGKVIDQANTGCIVNAAYLCADGDGQKEFQLLDTGKFKKLN